ncbi:dicarboxylate/amino acid:cation symporter [candidate division KSB1 bacterium]
MVVFFIAGIIFGKLVGPPIIPLAEILSEIFLKLLKMAILPLIIMAILSGLINVGGKGRIELLGIKTVAYCVSSTVIAILIGMTLTFIFKPGVGSPLASQTDIPDIELAQKTFTELLVDLIPENPFGALANADILPIILFTFLLAYFISKLDEKPRTTIADIVEPLFEAIQKMTQFVVWTAPLGVFGFNAKAVATTGLESFASLGYYVIIVIAGLLIHTLITFPVVLKIFSRKNPIIHFQGMVPAMMTAFATCSVMVALPFTMKASIEKSGVSRKTASFVCPVAAVINKDGTALYQAVSVLFLAQVYGIELSVYSLLIVIFTAFLASVATANIPLAGLVMMSIILRAIGLPLDAVALVIAVDRVLDMSRTTVNCITDMVAAVVVGRLEGEEV